MKFAILGAGATGGYLGACLARAGFDVTLIARGRHLEATRERGVRVLEADGSSFTARPACTDPLEAIAAAGIRRPRRRDRDQRLSRAGDRLRRLPIQLTQREAVSLEVLDDAGLEQSRCCETRSKRLRAISAALAQAGLKAPVQSRIRQEIWLKLIGNATLNPASALTRATLAELMGDAGTRDLIRRLMLEVEAVGIALGIKPDIGVDRRLYGAVRVGEHRTSMGQDTEAGRPLEVGALVGSVIELGHQLDVPVPTLKVVHQLTRQLDTSLRRVNS